MVIFKVGAFCHIDEVGIIGEYLIECFVIDFLRCFEVFAPPIAFFATVCERHIFGDIFSAIVGCFGLVSDFCEVGEAIRVVDNVKYSVILPFRPAVGHFAVKVT